MTTQQQLLRMLLLLQSALLAVGTIEAAMFGNPLALILPLTATLVLWWAIPRVTHLTSSAMRLIRSTEWILLASALISTLLAIFLARRLLEPVGLVTQWITPIVVLRLLKRSTITPPKLPKELSHGAH